MDTKVNYAVVGAFVISLVTVVVLGIIWLSSGLSIVEYSTYQVNMQEAVSGLSVDATVEYNGVNVGSVESIALNKKDPEHVKLLLSIHQGTPVTLGTVATLATRGLTGITYIALKDKGDDLRPLTKVDDHEYPIIKTAPSLLLQLNTGLQKLTDSLSQVSQTFNTLFDRQNLLMIKESLVNLREISANIAANNKQLSTILENTSLASERFPMLLQSSERTLQNFESQTLPDTNRLIANLNTITDNLTGFSAELRDNPSILIRGVKPRTLGPGEK